MGINHPILSDTLYFKSSNLITRQALHSSFISFVHPSNNLALSFFANLPSDMLALK